MTETKHTSWRISTVGKALIVALAKALGSNQTGVVERAVRELAQRQKVKL